MEKDVFTKQKKPGVAAIFSDRVDFRTVRIIRDKRGT